MQGSAFRLSQRRSGRAGFSLVELIVAVVIIIALVSMVIPGMAHMKRNAMKTAAKAQMHALQSALAQYHQDFNRYPVSSGQPYTQIALGRGGALLAQGLVGFLEADGGPTLALDKTTIGFRVTARADMGGKISGPYVALEPKQYKIGLFDQYFIDPWGKEILYYRSNYAVVRPAMVGKITRIFGTPATVPPGEAAYFSPEDCKLDFNKDPTVPDPTAAVPAFFQLLGSNSNTVGGTVVGADSYLLISAGPDGVYFTKDDIVSGK